MIKTKVISMIQLMEKGSVVYTVKIENLGSYEYIFDTRKQTTLYLNAPTLKMRDLNMLMAKPYEAYVLMGSKRVNIDGKEQIVDIPPRVFRHMKISENGSDVNIIFYEKGEIDGYESRRVV